MFGRTKSGRVKKRYTEHRELGFVPAEYYPGKDAYVGYSVREPATGIWHRKRQRVNGVAEADRAKYALKIVAALNKKLHAGWTPFDTANPHAKTSLTVALDEMLTDKMRELERTSFISYRSAKNRLQAFLKARQLETSPGAFTHAWAMVFMKEISATVGNRTYNNYVTLYRAFWSWFIQYGYCAENPFSGIKPKRAATKEREIIAKQWRGPIGDALKEAPAFRVACLLLYHCLIRPKELCLLRGRDFDLKAGLVFISASVAKNDTREKVTIPLVIIEEVRSYVANLPSDDHYLFTGHRTIRPGLKPMKRARLTEHWQKLRDKLGFPETYHLYSLKDTGIVQMLEDGVPIDEVKKQARHSSLEVTAAYLSYVAAGALENVRTRSTAF